MAENDDKEEREPWQNMMLDVAEMMEEALGAADEIISRHVGNTLRRGSCPGPRKAPPIDSVIRMAVAIFDATAAAEGGRRMMEAQKALAGSGQLLTPADALGKPRRM